MDITALSRFFNQLEEVQKSDKVRSDGKNEPVEYKDPYKRAVVHKIDEEYYNESEDAESKVLNYRNPKFQISYKQAVTTSDIYLQMGLKTASTSSCEDIVIKIELPNEKLNQINLKRTETHLELQSMNHYLKLKMPYPINPELGDAKWNSNDQTKHHRMDNQGAIGTSSVEPSDQVWDDKHIQELCLRARNFYHFPLNILRLRHLQVLDLSFNHLLRIPDSIKQLFLLNKLILQTNSLFDLPKSICQLKYLNVLNVSDNRLKALSFLSTKKRTMRISSGSDSDDYGDKNNKNLSNLDLRDNKLKGNIILGNYINLAEIDVSDNYIETIDLTAVDNLRSLNCSRNNLVRLSLNGKRLQNLIAPNNKLITISVTSAPIKLKVLDVSFNELSQIPDWFIDCNNIRTLAIDHNKLSILPDQFISNDMSHFQKLYLNHNNLIAFPNSIAKNGSLNEIRLEKNNLSILPKNFLRLFPNLKYLNLSCNKIKELPHSDTKLQIEHLYLSMNFFMDNTMEIVTHLCPKLKSFHGSYNSFTYIPNECAKSWPDLEELNLSKNNIFRIPNSMRNMRHLHILRLHSNQLKIIPNLCIDKLQVLDISNNEIDTIDLSKLISNQLRFLDISGNRRLHVDSRQFASYQSQKTLSLIDVYGCNRSLPTISKSIKKNCESMNANWSVGFAETAGSIMNHHLYVTQVRIPSFCDKEALFGLFDNEKLKEQPFILTNLLGRCLLEERSKTATESYYMKNTISSIQKELKSQGFHPVQNAIISHISYKESKTIIRIAILGDVQLLLGRKNGSLRLFSSTSVLKKTKSEPNPKTFELQLDSNDEFLLIANGGFWRAFHNCDDILADIRLDCEAILIAKKLQDVAQCFGVNSNLSIILIKLKIAREHVDHFLKELKQCVQQKSRGACDQDNTSLSVDNCCCDVACNHSGSKIWQNVTNGPRSSPSGQSEHSETNENSSTTSLKTSPTKMFLRNSNTSSEGKSYRGGVAKLIKGKKDEREDSDSGMSEEQFKCWEYMLEKNTQLLFDKELNTLSSVKSKSTLKSKRRLSRSSPQLSNNGTANMPPPLISRYFGNSRSNFNPLAQKMLPVRSLNYLNSGPNAAYFGSLQRLMPYNFEYDYSFFKQKSMPNFIERNVATTEL